MLFAWGMENIVRMCKMCVHICWTYLKYSIIYIPTGAEHPMPHIPLFLYLITVYVAVSL
jgi:hypothetical protein